MLLTAGLTVRQHAKGAVSRLVGDGSTVQDIIGSIPQLDVIDLQPLGSITFANDPVAKAVAAKWQDGHVCVSSRVLDFQVEQGTNIPKGTAYLGYDGPFLVGESWTPISASTK